MEKIDTDWKTTKLKSLAKLFKPFNRDCAPLLFYFSAFSLVLVSNEKIYQTLKTVFDHISKHLENGQRYSPVRCNFNSQLGVCKCGKAQLLPRSSSIMLSCMSYFDSLLGVWKCVKNRLYLAVRQWYSDACRVFISLLVVWKSCSIYCMKFPIFQAIYLHVISV